MAVRGALGLAQRLLRLGAAPATAGAAAGREPAIAPAHPAGVCPQPRHLRESAAGAGPGLKPSLTPFVPLLQTPFLILPIG